ncbi:MAG: ribosome small subunit-dependent GTPase A [Candidatus Hydrogenedentes bacterium]|nr:ribosome small subunit-dependent GTPase A [Candidatus Hydrogenedentota bacterium]
MKKKKLDKKKRLEVRKKDWSGEDEDYFSKDSTRHTKAMVTLPDEDIDAQIPQDIQPNATVVSHSKKWAFVWIDNSETKEEILCGISEKLREKDESLIAPGDRVYVDYINQKEPIIRWIFPRKSKLSRLSVDKDGPPEQVIAANVDILFIVASVKQPPFRHRLIDRFLIVAQNGNVEPVIVLNKIDLADEIPQEINVYRELGIKLIFTSCVTKAGIDEVVETLRGKTGVLAGHSGVGKTSLIKCILPDIDAVTKEISKKTEKGRHATNISKLYFLPNGGKIIDTPGIRALGLWKIDPEELDFYFSEFREFSTMCKFNDCSHTHEPECAVRNAVKEGKISCSRYESYLRIRKSLEQCGITPGRFQVENIPLNTAQDLG